MPDISQDLQDILDARYGEEVRGSIHDAIEDINDVCESNVSTVQGLTDDAEGFAETSEAYAKGTVNGTAVGSGDVGYEDNSLYYKTQAETQATLSESYSQGGTGTRTGEDTDNSKYYKEQAEYWYNQAYSIASQLSGVLKPQGTVTFANLPSLSSAAVGDMYNISDEFTTTADFVEGAGHVIPLGSNVYKTANSLWDVLAGSPVTGVKGDSETNYRAGNVNITKANIGLGNVRNVDIGATDISGIGNGTVTGAISTLNSNLDNYRVLASVTTDGVKTVGTLLSELYAITGDVSDPKTVIKFNGAIHRYVNTNLFSFSVSGSSSCVVYTIRLSEGARLHWAFNANGNAYGDDSSAVLSSGLVIALCK